MAGNQETLIYIEEQNKSEAEFMSRSFVNAELKNRAYINALGAELVTKYLTTEGVDTSDAHNLHSISKFLEILDISDILLPNIHIDVRVIFNEQQIFIPKSHFEYNVTPDIYVVLKLAQDFSHVEFLGYFEPAKINKNNQNSEYYFVDKDSLFPAEKLVQYVKDFSGNTDRGITEEQMLHARELFISMADHNITVDGQKELIKLMLLSNSLRDSILEFDNFETLSYTVGSQFADKLVKVAAPVADIVAEEITTEEFIEDELTENSEDEESQTENQDTTQDVEIEDEIEEPALEESIEFEDLSEEEPIEEEVSDIQTIDVVEETIETQGSDEILEQEPSNDLDFDVSFEDDMLLDEDIQPFEETILEEETAEPLKDEKEDENVKPSDKIIENVLEKTIETVGGVAAAGAVAGAVAAAGAIAAESAGVEAAAAASEEAMKLAGVAGELVSEVINKNIEDQNKSLDKIDFDKNAVDATEIPEEVAAYALGDVKHEANVEAEESGQFDTPKDLSELQTVENTNMIGYEEIEHETVDLEAMDSVQLEDFSEATDELEDLSELTSIESPTTPVADLEEKMMEQKLSEVEHLADLGFETSTISINDDGTSSLDNFNFDIGMDTTADENLVDLGMTNGIVLDDNIEPLDLGGFEENLNIDNDVENLSNIIEKKEEETSFDLPAAEEIETFEPAEIPTEEIAQAPVEEETIAEDINFSDEEVLLGEDDLNALTLDEEITQVEEVNDVIETAEPVVEEEFVSEEVITEEFPSQETTSEESDETSIDDFLSELEGAVFEEENTQETVEETTVSEDIVFENEVVEEIQTDSLEENIEDDFTELETTDTQVQDEVQAASEEEWLEDTNYDNLQDVEPLQNAEEIQNTEVEEDIISEPEQLQERVFAVTENSRVISDRNFAVGEIPIDINNPQMEEFEGSEHLGDLYNEDNNVPGAALLQTPGRLGSAGGNAPKGLGAGLGIIGVILTLIIVGVIGFSVSKIMGNKSDETPQPITDDALPTSPDNGVSDANTLKIDQNNVVNMDNTQPAPVTPKVQEASKPKAQAAAPVQTATPAVKSVKAGPTTFLEVKKLTWEVPDYISYNSNFKQYFQSAGKSLKLSLTSDLLLAKEYAYTDQVRVSVTFNKDGSFKEARTLLSSGSKEIDRIVLQTVNQTLKVLKAPHSVGNDESTTVILKIYF